MEFFKRKGVILDFDGTIADSREIAIEAAIKTILKLAKSEVSDVEEIFPKLGELTMKEIVDHFKIDKLTLVNVLIGAQKEMYKKVDQIKPFDGILDQLRELKKDNIKIGVLTSNSKKLVTTFIKQQNAQDVFDFVYSEKQFFGKHISLKKILLKQRLNKKHTVYIGDETRDIEAAHKAGLTGVAVAWGFNKRKRLEETHPQLILDSVREFEQVRNLL